MYKLYEDEAESASNDDDDGADGAVNEDDKAPREEPNPPNTDGWETAELYPPKPRLDGDGAVELSNDDWSVAAMETVEGLS